MFILGSTNFVYIPRNRYKVIANSSYSNLIQTINVDPYHLLEKQVEFHFFGYTSVI